jgi:hypothetical protein
MNTKSKLLVAAAFMVGFTVPALAETSDIEELVRNSGHPVGIQATQPPGVFAQTPATTVRMSRAPGAPLAQRSSPAG